GTVSTPYEQGKAALDELMQWADENSEGIRRNEATTRLHLIDRLLTTVLAWPIAEIEAEHAHDSEYLDYKIGRPFPRMIVEAKREGLYFSLPIGITSPVQKLTSLTDGGLGKNLKAAAQQVVGYCGANGVPLAVVCNGTQIVAFLGT